MNEKMIIYTVLFLYHLINIDKYSSFLKKIIHFNRRFKIYHKFKGLVWTHFRQRFKNENKIAKNY